MTYRMNYATTIATWIGPKMSRQPTAAVLILNDDELARMSGGDGRPTSMPKDTTRNKATVSQQTAAAADAYLRA